MSLHSQLKTPQAIQEVAAISADQCSATQINEFAQPVEDATSNSRSCCNFC
jgi:hypothetical protein